MTRQRSHAGEFQFDFWLTDLKIPGLLTFGYDCDSLGIPVRKTEAKMRDSSLLPPSPDSPPLRCYDDLC